MAKILLKDMNSNVVPVLNFGYRYGDLEYRYQDVFQYYDYIEEDIEQAGLDTDSYNEAMRLIRDHYDGTYDFFRQVQDIAPRFIQEAFDMYGIEATIIPGTCEWSHGSVDGCMEFDMYVDAAWVEDTINEYLADPDYRFAEFLKAQFSSRSGFISRMPNTPQALENLMDPHDEEYWRAVSVLIRYIVNSDEVVSQDVQESMNDYLVENCDYVTYSELGLD